MIPVKMKPEPTDFEKRVKNKGETFLKKVTTPTKHQWKKKAYWQDILRDLHTTYDGICAYSAEWIPFTTGDPCVDHYIPKSIKPELAYDWSNYRLACLKFNGWKSDHQDVLDPFTLPANWFYLDLPSMQIKPSIGLPNSETKAVWDTIGRLRLNGEICIESRSRWLMQYRDREITFGFLEKHAPFIAYELKRQNLVDNIANILIK